MTKYEMFVHKSKNYGNGYIEEYKEYYYSSYLSNLLSKFEKIKQLTEDDFLINIAIHKIENIRTFKAVDSRLIYENEKDKIFICSFNSYGSHYYLGDCKNG